MPKELPGHRALKCKETGNGAHRPKRPVKDERLNEISGGNVGESAHKAFDYELLGI